MNWCNLSHITYFKRKSIKYIRNVFFFRFWITQMMSYESLHIFKLIKILSPYNFLTLWNFFLQCSTLFKIKQYQLCPVISMHVEKQCSNSLKQTYAKIVFPYTSIQIEWHFYMLAIYPAGTWRWNVVVLMSMRRSDVALTSLRSHLNVNYPLGVRRGLNN